MQFIRTDLDYKPDMKPLLKVVFEVVVVDDQFGIRFTDIVSPQERVRRLQ